MNRYRIEYVVDGGRHGSDEVLADTFHDVADPLTDAALWIDFFRYVDDGHADLLAERVMRIRADRVVRIAQVEGTY